MEWVIAIRIHLNDRSALLGDICELDRATLKSDVFEYTPYTTIARTAVTPIDLNPATNNSY